MRRYIASHATAPALLTLAALLALIAGMLPVGPLAGLVPVAMAGPLAFPISRNFNNPGIVRSLALGDFDGDGTLDVVSGDDERSSGVYLNDGQGNLRAQAIYADFQSRVLAVVTGDLDGDGDLDYVVGKYGQQDLIYLNDGAANFTSQPFGPADSATLSLALGDIDGDGALDIVVGTMSGGTIYLQTDPGSFSPYIFFGFGSRIQSIALGDVWAASPGLEIVAAQGAPCYWYEGSGCATAADTSAIYFVDPTGAALPYNTSILLGDSAVGAGVALGDLDGDGDLDIAQVNNTSGKGAIYLNDGVGFGPASVFGGSSQMASGVALADMNGDGALDILLSQSNGPSEIYLNGGGSFGASPSLTVGNSDLSIAAGDMNGDGHLDLLRGASFSGAYIQFSNGAASALAVRDLPAMGSVRSMAWGDIDGDGNQDLVVGTAYGSMRVLAGYSPASGGFARAATYDQSELINGIPDSPNIMSLIVADLDGDGDLDIAYGYASIVSTPALRILLNTNGSYSSFSQYGSTDVGYASLAAGDVDGDGDIDIVAGDRPNGALQEGARTIYLNNGAGGFSVGQSFDTPFADGGYANSMALGDLDGDGVPDLVAANGAWVRVHMNRGDGQFAPSYTLRENTDNASEVALADLDGDGAIDIVVGNNDEYDAIYLNDGRGNFPTRRQLISRSVHLALGDIDNDGDTDLISGAYQGPPAIYLNDATMQLLISRDLDPAAGSAPMLALGDVNGDGATDIALGSGKFLVNQAGRSRGLPNNPPTIAISAPGPTAPAPTTSSPTILGSPTLPLTITLNDAESDPVDELRVEYSLDGGGNWRPAIAASGTITRDLATLPEHFVSRPATPLSIPDPGVVTATLSVGAPIGGSVDTISDVNVELTLTHSYDGDLAARLIAPDGTAVPLFAGVGVDGDGMTGLLLDDAAGTAVAAGSAPFSGRFRPAGSLAALHGRNPFGVWKLELTDTTGSDFGALVAWGLQIKTANTRHVFQWDTFASGVFGQIDQVVVRAIAYPRISAQTNAVGVSALRPYVAATSYPFRVRGGQVQVLAASGNPAPGATVYRIPSGQQAGGAIGRSDGRPYLTDAQGYLPGRGSLGVGDKLIAVTPISTTETFTRYLTSAAVGADGPALFSVSQPGVQTLRVKQANPLLALNLSVSLEWDAREDQAYLDQLQSDLRRASELLYIWTDGQVALGKVTIYQNKEHWADADVQLSASNSLRPNANQGGIVRVDTPDPARPGLIYERGQIRMGAVWTRFGDASSQGGEDWPRAFAHELGHWALFLDEDYLGFDANKNLVSVAGCASPMADPYRSDYGQFRAATPAACQATLNQQVSGRTNWATIKAFYDAPALGWRLNAPTSFAPNSGPSSLPFAITVIGAAPPAGSTDSLVDVPILGLQRTNGTRYLATGGAKAVLFSSDGTRATDLGTPERGEVNARGARVGDRLCVFDLDDQKLGCLTMASGATQLTIVDKPGWTPELLVTPVTSRTYQLRVDNLPAGLALRAKLYASEGGPSSVVLLARSGASYQASVNLAAPILAGTLQVWVEEGGGRREVVADYALGGNPAPPNKPKKRKGKNAPALSPDGQVVLFSDNLSFSPGSYFAIQSLTSLPLAAPAWTVPVGYGYRLLASANAPSLVGTSLNMSYLESDVLPGTEGGIGMYYLPAGGTRWQRLPTRLDPQVNEISAKAMGPGTYVLMSSADLRTGWNLLSYPFPTPTVAVVEGLKLVGGSGAYTTVYGYDPADSADPWDVYDIGAPAFVNDLTLLRYGRGYWVRATASASTAALAGAALDQAGSPERPSTIYGTVAGGVAGQAVEARIGATLCASARTQMASGKVVFVLDVPSAGQMAGCGTPNAAVTVRVNGSAFGSTVWQADRPREIRFGDSAFLRVYLPILSRGGQ